MEISNVQHQKQTQRLTKQNIPYSKVTPEIVPTYHTHHSKAEVNTNEPLIRTKKIRSKLICIFPKWKYLVSRTTVEEYHSLFGGVIDQINQKNHFSSILTSLEKEFHEETSETIKINFQMRKLIYHSPKFYTSDLEIVEIPFIYIGTFCESDTIFTVIYIPKISNDVIELWNKQIRQTQENLLRKLFEGWKIDLEKIFEVNRIYHKKLMRIKSQYSYMSKPMFNFICSRLVNYHHVLEKTGVELMDEDKFFDMTMVWEWNTMNYQTIKTKIKDLFQKTGVQVN